MRKGWFRLARIGTKWNPADLNTKALSRERRELLSRMIGLWSDSYGEQSEMMPQVRRILKLLLMASVLKGCEQPDEGEETCRSDGKNNAVIFNLSFSVAVLCFWILVLLLVIYYVEQHQRVRQFNTILQRRLTSRAIQDERDELNASGNGTDDEDDDDDDEDFPDGRGGRRMRDLGGGYYAVPASGSRTESPRGHDSEGWYWDPSDDRSWYDCGSGKGLRNRGRAGSRTAESSTAREIPREGEGETEQENEEMNNVNEDVEEEPMPERHVRSENEHTMMPPDDNEEDEIFEDEEAEENENEGQNERRTRQRGAVSVSDLVVAELLAQGRELRRQAATSSDGPGDIMLPGSEFVMQKWDLPGIPADTTNFHAWRSDLRCMIFGLEIDLARILQALENHLRELQAMHNPFYHRDCKKVRSALLCQRPEPQGYMSAAITFMKWEESGR